MATTSKAKGKKRRSSPSTPCEVFFACTLCGNRCRSVPQLYSHYQSAHKGMLNATKPKEKPREEDVVCDKAAGSNNSSSSHEAKIPSSSSSPTAEKISSRDLSPNHSKDGASSPGRDESESGSKKRKLSGVSNDEGIKEEPPKSESGSELKDETPSAPPDGKVSPSDSKTSEDSDRLAKRGSDSPTSCDPNSTGNKNSDGSKADSPDVKSDDASSSRPGDSGSQGSTQSTEDANSVVTRKKNVPLGMLKGKNNSLMVIFQHADQTKPLPEGSSFKLRNSGGEQTYMVVANVDVDIVETYAKRKTPSRPK